MMNRHRHWRGAIAVAVSLAMSCGGDKRSEPAQAPPGPAADGGNPLGNLQMLGDMLTQRLKEPGPYDEPRRSDDFDNDAPYTAVIELSGPIAEMSSFSLLSGSGGTELRAIDKRLRALADNARVTGLLIRFGGLSMTAATAEELRAKLVAFKTAGERTRKLLCHTESASNLTYYAMTACDRIGLAPVGEIAITGVSATPMHIKGALDKLRVEPDFVHIGAYKGAAEPFTRDAPSAQMRETLDGILDQAFATLVAGVADGRSLEPDAVRGLIDRAMFDGVAAREARLIDEVAIYEAFRDQAIEGAWTVVAIDDDGDDSGKPDIAELMQKLGLVPRPRPTEPHIALVYAVGNIIDGKGDGVLGADEEIASRPLAAALRALARDDRVAGIVLRIDSGGGSALASEIIWHAVAEAKARKPVVVSMAGMAASGGYYIACGATRIFALDNTLTGSIGVVGGKLAFGAALADIGVRAYPQQRGKRAALTSPWDRWTNDEREAVREEMKGVYKTFVGHVATGRGASYEDIDAIAQGRVWTGAQAKERGLVDEIGGLDAALAAARELAGVEPQVALEVYPPEPTLIDIVKSLDSFGASAQASAAQAVLADVDRALGPMAAQAARRLLSQLMAMRDARVLTAAMFPVVVQ